MNNESGWTVEWFLNMRLAPTIWTAEPWEFQYFPNRSYLNSVWLGCIWNIVLVPWRILHEVLVPLCQLRLGVTLMLAFLLVWSVIRLFVAGLLGRVCAARMPVEVSVVTHTMSPADADLAIAAGKLDMMIHRSKL